MIRFALTAFAICLFIGCRQPEQSVAIVPIAEPGPFEDIPVDPFGASSPAYEQLKEVTEAALHNPWDGELASFAPWLEQQTVSVERALRMLKGIRVGPQDVYAVANGRIAMVYVQIAAALTEASVLAESEGQTEDWTGQQGVIWQQAANFWARCVRGCGMSGPHLDGWDLRCRAGLAESEAQISP